MITAALQEQLEATIKQFVEDKAAFSAYDVTVVTREREKMMLRHFPIRDDIHRLPVIIGILQQGYERTLCNMWKCSCGHAFLLEDGDDQGLCPACDEEDASKQGQVILYHPSGYDIDEYQLRSGATPNGPKQQERPTTRTMPDKITPVPDGLLGASARDFMKDRLHKEGVVIPPIPKGDTINTVINRLTPSGPAFKSPPSQEVELDYRNRLEVPSDFLTAIGIGSSEDCYVIPDPNANEVIITKNANMDAHGCAVCTQKSEHGGNVRLPSRFLTMAGLSEKKFQIEAVSASGTAVVRIREIG